MTKNNLRTGDLSENGQIKIKIIDQDRLCYKVASNSKGAYGIRTISKDLVEEFYELYEKNPNISTTEARNSLCGKSDIDKFEYGYVATLWQMAMMLDKKRKEGDARKGNRPHQVIYYGAPGTGKSHKVKEQLEGVPEENIFRTTFHPDSDYSTFVGAYKPTMEKRRDVLYSKQELIDKLAEMKDNGVKYPSQKFGARYWRSLKAMTSSDKKDMIHACDMPDSLLVEIDKGIVLGEEFLTNSGESRIVYSFVAQAFLNAYIRAYQTEEDVYLVIEEINRGNCAQIFGDLFQLLDRDENGVSEYPIKADADLRTFLEDELGIENPGIAGGELCLPANLHIWATMNTSDQSLFPIDSAFKRRWDWHYIPISQGKDQYGQLMNWTIVAGDKKYSWWSFLTKINKHIWNTTHSEDKKLGFFFCNTPDGEIDADTFVSKVIFYLWNDVYKDYGFNDPIFNGDNNEPMKFDEFYTSGSEEAEANTSTIQRFLGNLEVDPVSEDKSDTAAE